MRFLKGRLGRRLLLMLRKGAVSGGLDAARWIEKESAGSSEARTGALVFSALYALSYAQSALGLPADAMEAASRLLARGSFLAEKILFHGYVLLFYLAAGSILGAVWRNASAWMAGLWPSFKRMLMSRRNRRLFSAAAVLFMHAVYLASHIRGHPALYRGFKGLAVLPAWALLPAQALAVSMGLLALFQLSRRFHAWQKKFPPHKRFGALVLAGFFLAVILGLWGVHAIQRSGNQGPNVLVLAVPGPISPKGISPGPGTFYSACFTPLAVPEAALMTLLTGRTPLTHGVRHAFPRREDVSLSETDLPAILKGAGYSTSVLSDGRGSLFSRLSRSFDRVRAPGYSIPSQARAAILRRHCHLFPYLSGKLGRRLFTSMRSVSPDPDALASEAGDELGRLKFHDKFFLAVYFTSREPSGTSIESILKSLSKAGLSRKTLVVLWGLPDDSFTPGALWISGSSDAHPAEVNVPVRAQDIAPTLISLLGLSVPEAMEGFPLNRRDFSMPPLENFAVYGEAAGPFMTTGASDRITPELLRMLEIDYQSTPYVTLKRSAEDAVLVGKDRFIQWGFERLRYSPTSEGARYRLFQIDRDPEAREDVSKTPAGMKRAKELKEMFFRILARELGWRPQNDYWIPEAFLRE